MKCELEGCDNDLVTGSRFCSRSCAAKFRHQNKKKEEKSSYAVLTRAGLVPGGLVNKLQDKFGHEANQVIQDVVVTLAEAQSTKIPLPISSVTYSDIVLSFDGKEDLRPNTRLSFDVLEDMLRNGMVLFCSGMKRSQVSKQFTKGRFTVTSPDQELAEVAQASLETILPKMAGDFTFSSVVYGTSFQEEVWEWKTKYELGLGESRNARATFLVPKVPNSINPATVKHIRRDSKEKFNGFAQQRRDAEIGTIDVDREPALVIPFNSRFGNLWGIPLLENMYVNWLWYEIIVRSMHRYMERMAMPTTVGRAPSTATVEVEGEDGYIDALDVVLAVAGNVARSNAVAIPSDRDENGDFLWDLGYMEAAGRAQLYVEVLSFLGQEMLRSVLSADRSLTQSSGGVGSYNIGEIHAQASAWSSELMLISYLFYLNLYFMPGYSLYNRGRNGPPIMLEAQTLDTQDRQLLMNLINIAGNSEAGQLFFDIIDWRELAEKSNISTKTEAEMKREREDRFKESLDHQKRQQDMMQKYKVDGELQKKDASGKQDVEKNAEDAQVKQEDMTKAVLHLMDSGQRIPVMIGESHARHIQSG